MKAVIPVLVLVAVGGLAWVGLAPEAEPTPAPRIEYAQPVFAGQVDPAPVFTGQLPAFNLQPGAVFDPTRPVIVRVPPGYNSIPPGDYQLPPRFRPNPLGGPDIPEHAWHMGTRDSFGFHVGRTLPTGYNLILHYGIAGQRLVNGKSEPVAFSAGGVIAPDGTWTLTDFSIPPRFPAASGPFFVFQP